MTYLPQDKHNVLNKKPNIEKAAQAFGHDPRTSLDEGVPKTLEWMEEFYSNRA